MSDPAGHNQSNAHSSGPASHTARHRERVRRRRPGAGMSLHLAPMIDVTFLLLIFFLLSTTFRRPEGILGANLPRESGPPSVALPISPVVVRLTSTGPAPGDYAIQIDNFEAQPVTFGELTQFLVDIRRNEGFDDETPVVIVASVDTLWEPVVDCWNAAVRAACKNISFGGEGE